MGHGIRPKAVPGVESGQMWTTLSVVDKPAPRMGCNPATFS